MTKWLVPVVVAEVEAADAVAVAVEEAVVLVVVELAPPVAPAWNAGKLLPGLIAKTIPCWQWLACLQYAQTGLVSSTVN